MNDPKGYRTYAIYLLVALAYAFVFVGIFNGRQAITMPYFRDWIWSNHPLIIHVCVGYALFFALWPTNWKTIPMIFTVPLAGWGILIASMIYGANISNPEIGQALYFNTIATIMACVCLAAWATLAWLTTLTIKRQLANKSL